MNATLPTDRFPIKLLLAPPVVTAVGVLMVAMIVGGSEQHLEGFEALILGMTVVLMWLGPFVALFAVPKAVLALYQGTARTTGLRIGAVVLAMGYLLSFAVWLVGGMRLVLGGRMGRVTRRP